MAIDPSGPVGLFDSGVGGLSVLAELRRHLPHESFAYVADQRFAPYGDRTLDEVRERSVHITGALIDAGAKAVVVACNSASAAALHHLRAVRPGFPFIGMEPAVKPAALESRSGVIGVLATSATFQGELFASVVDKHAGDVEVITVAEPVLLHLVEDGPDAARGGGDVLDAVISHLLARRVDTIVLGCTHYAFLKDAIRRLCGPGVAIVDPAPSVARQVGRVLEQEGTATPGTRPGGVRYHTTSDPARFAASIGPLLGRPASTAPMRWPTT